MTMRNSLQHLLGSASLIAGLMMMASLPATPQQGPRGNPDGCCLNGGTCCLTGAVLPATADEVKWLTFMREEEKMVRDVYQQLYAKWKLRIFDNIARAEARHFESMGALLARYEIADPAASSAPGVYADQRLSAFYNELIAKGAKSLKDALEVGVLIEKQDIGDLETALKATEKTDIKTVYTNLLAASLSHQDAFELTLEVLVANP